MRLKIIAGNLIAVLVLGVASYFVVRNQIKSGLDQQLEGRIVKDSQLFDRAWRQTSSELRELTRQQSSQNGIRAVFTALDERARRQKANKEANSVATWFRDPSRRGEAPDLVAILDETGTVIARNADVNRLFGKSLVREIPTLTKVLESGNAQVDLWQDEDKKLLQVGLAAILNEERAIVGVLLVGFDLSTGLVQREAGMMGRDIAFLTEDRVYSSSLGAAAGSSLQDYLFKANKDKTIASLNGKGAPWTAELSSAEYLGLSAALPMAPSVKAGFAVLANRTAHTELVSVANIILMLTLLCALGVIAYGFVIAGALLRPIEAIEEGVLAVINGRKDFRLDIKSAEFGGLGYRINQLINEFMGISETDESGISHGGGSGWDAVQSSATNTSPAAGTPASSADAELANEAELTYQERIYNEYVAAKKAAGEDVSNITKDRFLGRLLKNAEALKKKHNCRMVRFRVLSNGGQVSLKPVIIR